MISQFPFIIPFLQLRLCNLINSNRKWGMRSHDNTLLIGTQQVGGWAGLCLYKQCMNSMKLVIPLHFTSWKKDSKRCCDTTTPESIHTKDESKRGSAFAFMFGVNWPVQWDVTEWQVSWNSCLDDFASLVTSGSVQGPLLQSFFEAVI